MMSASRLDIIALDSGMVIREYSYDVRLFILQSRLSVVPSLHTRTVVRGRAEIVRL